MLPPKVKRSTMAAQGRGSVKVLVQPLKLSLNAIAMLLVSSRLMGGHKTAPAVPGVVMLGLDAWLCSGARSPNAQDLGSTWDAGNPYTAQHGLMSPTSTTSSEACPAPKAVGVCAASGSSETGQLTGGGPPTTPACSPTCSRAAASSRSSRLAPI